MHAKNSNKKENEKFEQWAKTLLDKQIIKIDGDLLVKFSFYLLPPVFNLFIPLSGFFQVFPEKPQLCSY